MGVFMKKRKLYIYVGLFLISFTTQVAFADGSNLKCQKVAEKKALKFAIEELEVTAEEFQSDYYLVFSEVSKDKKREDYQWSDGSGSGGIGVTIKRVYKQSKKSNKKYLTCRVKDVYVFQDDGDESGDEE